MDVAPLLANYRLTFFLRCSSASCISHQGGLFVHQERGYLGWLFFLCVLLCFVFPFTTAPPNFNILIPYHNFTLPAYHVLPFLRSSNYLPPLKSPTFFFFCLIWMACQVLREKDGVLVFRKTITYQPQTILQGGQTFQKEGDLQKKKKNRPKKVCLYI